MNNKGITLVTVAVMIIVIIIIATTSIVAGNRLLFNSRELVDAQMLESVREAAIRRKNEIDMQGTITPLGETYPGQLSPYIADGAFEAVGWFLLNEEALDDLGVKKAKERYLVNYKKSTVLSMADNEYVEKYLVYVFMDKIMDKRKTNAILGYPGEELQNSTAIDSGKMYVDRSGKNGIETYGTGWYKLSKEEMILELTDSFTGVNLSNFMKNDYLINFDDYKFVKFTSNMVAE